VKIALLSFFQGLENKSKRNENHVRDLCVAGREARW
jgi:hypothetical protein